MPDPTCVPGLSRVGYFNGQRLDAADFRTEQEYHIDVRRELTKALFSAGIAQGLDVLAPRFDPDAFAPDQKDANIIKVTTGLALDGYGRAIILSEDTELPVPGLQGVEDQSLPRLYLTIRYGERRTQARSGLCAEPSSQGSPSRIESTACLELLALPPSDADHERVVLAELWLDHECMVSKIGRNVREHVNVAPRRGTRPLALEGEKDIDRYNPKLLVFHVTGERPNSVVLYLRGRQFSTLYYTQLGLHSHGQDDETGTESGGTHQHDVNADQSGAGDVELTLETSLASVDWRHSHRFHSNVNIPFTKNELDNRPLDNTAIVLNAPESWTGDGTDPVISGVWRDLSGLKIVSSPENPFSGYLSDQLAGYDYHGDTASRGGPKVALPIVYPAHAPDVYTTKEPDFTHRHVLSLGKQAIAGSVSIGGGAHAHPIAPIEDSGTAVTELGGASLASALRPQPEADPLTYIDDLRVIIHDKNGAKRDVTDDLILQARGAHAAGGPWGSLAPGDRKLGNGAPGHPLNTDTGNTDHTGTPALQLHLLEGVDFAPNEAHTIELRVDNDSGGCIQYSLYVE